MIKQLFSMHLPRGRIQVGERATPDLTSRRRSQMHMTSCLFPFATSLGKTQQPLLRSQGLARQGHRATGHMLRQAAVLNGHRATGKQQCGTACHRQAAVLNGLLSHRLLQGLRQRHSRTPQRKNLRKPKKHHLFSTAKVLAKLRPRCLLHQRQATVLNGLLSRRQHKNLRKPKKHHVFSAAKVLANLRPPYHRQATVLHGLLQTSLAVLGSLNQNP